MSDELPEDELPEAEQDPRPFAQIVAEYDLLHSVYELLNSAQDLTGEQDEDEDEDELL
jgi:hypothetical protein